MDFEFGFARLRLKSFNFGYGVSGLGFGITKLHSHNSDRPNEVCELAVWRLDFEGSAEVQLLGLRLALGCRMASPKTSRL